MKSQAKVYPKQWPKEYTFLRSPFSNVVHLASMYDDWKEKAVEEERSVKSQPMCGVWCWPNVVPVLKEDLDNNPKLRFCKNCVRYMDDDFWQERMAKRADYIYMESCKVK